MSGEWIAILIFCGVIAFFGFVLYLAFSTSQEEEETTGQIHQAGGYRPDNWFAQIAWDLLLRRCASTVLSAAVVVMVGAISLFTG